MSLAVAIFVAGLLWQHNTTTKFVIEPILRSSTFINPLHTTCSTDWRFAASLHSPGELCEGGEDIKPCSLYQTSEDQLIVCQVGPWLQLHGVHLTVLLCLQENETAQCLTEIQGVVYCDYFDSPQTFHGTMCMCVACSILLSAAVCSHYSSYKLLLYCSFMVF